MDEPTPCTVCDKYEPKYYCWAARMDCPFKPPRYMNLEQLWAYVRTLEKRVEKLEGK